MNAMTPVTGVIALLLCIAMMFGPMGRGIGLIIASALIWPEYLRVPVGPAQMSAPRIAAMALLIRAAATPHGPPFRWRGVDSCVFFGWAWILTAAFITKADQVQITFLIGSFFDTVLMYFAARFAVRTAADFKAMLPPLVAAGIWMGFFGAAEAMTTRSPYQILERYGSWEAWFIKPPDFRLGMLRAQGSTGHAIYFGMAMTALVGMIFALRKFAGTWLGWLPGLGMAILGAFSSLSSGPYIALMLTFILNSFHFMRSLVKPAAIAAAVVAIFAEFASNRHFWDLIDYLALNKGTGWYRSRLLEVAAANWHEWWLAGTGTRPLDHWGQQLDGRNHVDLVNNYVIIAVRGGFLGLGLYLVAKFLAIRDAIRMGSVGREPWSSCGFALAACFLAISTAEMSVGLFGPVLLMSYMLMGVMVQDAPVRQGVPAPARTPKRRPQSTPARGPAIEPSPATRQNA